MNIKNMLSGLTLLGMGGVAGYFIAKKKLQARYQEDVADIQDFYYKKLQEAGIMEADFEPEELSDEEILEEFKKAGGMSTLAGADFDGDDLHPRDVNDKILYMDDIPAITPRKDDKKRTETSKDTKTDRGKGRPIINYNKPSLEQFLSAVEDEGDEEIDDVDEDEDPDYEAEIEARAEEYAQRRYENQVSGEPYCINYDEYEDAPDGYDQQVLYYYAQDRILCEDDDSIIDEEEIVGLDYEDVLSMQTIAWVRNDQLCVLYEIHRIDKAYSDVVANAIETPREREFRLMSRRKQALDEK